MTLLRGQRVPMTGPPTKEGTIFTLAIFTYVAVRYGRDNRPFEIMVLILVLRVSGC